MNDESGAEFDVSMRERVKPPHKPIKCGICRIFLSTLLYWIISLSTYELLLCFLFQLEIPFVGFSGLTCDPCCKRKLESLHVFFIYISSLSSALCCADENGAEKCQIFSVRLPHTCDTKDPKNYIKSLKNCTIEMAKGKKGQRFLEFSTCYSRKLNLTLI